MPTQKVTIQVVLKDLFSDNADKSSKAADTLEKAIVDAAKEVPALGVALTKVEDVLKKVSKSVDGSMGSIHDVGEAVKEAGAEIEKADIGGEFEKVGREVTEASKDIEKASKKTKDSTDRIKKSAQDFGAQLEKSVGRIPLLGRGIVGLSNSIDNARSRFKTIRDFFKAFLTETPTGRNLVALGRTIRGFASGAVSAFDGVRRAVFSLRTAFLGLAAVAAGLTVRRFVQIAADVQTGIARIATLLPDATQAQLDTLSRQLKAIAIESGQTFKDEFEAAFEAIQAGVPGNELIQFLRSANRLAVAGVTDVATANKLLLTVMRAYNIEFTKASEVSDRLFAIQQAEGNVTIPQLADAIGTVAADARQAGISLEELGAAFSALTTLVSPDEASTRLRAFINEIVSLTPEARRQLQRLGVDLSVSGIRANGLAKTLQDLERATGGNIESVQRYVNNIRALSGALILTQDGAGAFIRSLETISGSAGATDRGFARLFETLNVQTARFRSAFAGLVDELVRRWLPQITELFETLTEAADLAARIAQTDISTSSFSDEFFDSLASLGNLFLTIAKEVGRVIALTFLEVARSGIAAITPVLRRVFNDALGPLIEQASFGTIPFVPSAAAGIEKSKKEIEEAQADVEKFDGFVKTLDNDVEQLTQKLTAYRNAGIEQIVVGGSIVLEPFKTDLETAQKYLDEYIRLRNFNLQRANDAAFRLAVSKANLQSFRNQIADEDQAIRDEMALSLTQFFDNMDSLVTGSLGRIDTAIDEAAADLSRLRDAVGSSLDDQALPTPKLDTSKAAQDALKVLDEIFRAAKEKTRQAIRDQLGLTIEAIEETERRIFDLEVERRRAVAAGDDARATRLQQEIRQLSELLEIRQDFVQADQQGAGDLDETRRRIEAIAALQQAEVRRFQVEQLIADQSRALATATRNYEAALADLQERQAAGLPVTRAQAREVELLRRTLDATAARVKAAVSGIVESGIDLPDAVSAQLQSLQAELRQVEVTAQESGGSIGSGLLAGVEQFRQSVGSTFQQAAQLGSSLASNLINGLGGAVRTLADNFDNAGQAFATFARDFLLSIAEMAARALAFRAIFGTPGEGTSAGGLFGGFLAAFGSRGGLASALPVGVQSFAHGGLVRGPRSPQGVDRIPAMLRAREFVQPESSVDHYGVDIMEALRRRLIPRALLAPFAAPAYRNPGPGFADGGAVGGSGMSGIPIAALPMDSGSLDRLTRAQYTHLRRFLQENRSFVSDLLRRGNR